MTREEIYLDNQTVTKPSLSAIESMISLSKTHWGIPSSPHQKGQELFAPIDWAMSRIYEAVGADFGDSFTWKVSREEASAQVVLSTYIDCTRETGRNHFLVAEVEELAILHAVKSLQKLGSATKWLTLDACGRILPDVLEKAITPRTALVSLSWANSLTGVIQPVADLTRICLAKGVKIHVDASAVIGKLFFRFKDAEIDYLTFDGDCFHAPKGTGGLFCRKKSPLMPFFDGSFPMHVASLVALATAMDEAEENRDTLCTETARLRDSFESSILEKFPSAQLLFQEIERLPNVSVIAFPGVAAEALLYALHRQGIYATMGREESGSLEYVLQICGIEKGLAHSALSFALSHSTREEEIERAVTIITKTALHLRTITGSLV